MSTNAQPNRKICVAVGSGLGLWLSSGNWIIGLVVGIGAAAMFDENMRRRRGLPARRALIEFGKKDRPPE